jgi:nucleoside-diphosphate-sugar epimerase
MMKIAIVGATGPTGIHLVTELRKSVTTVRVIARSIDKLARLFPEAAVEKLSADILDADATLRAGRSYCDRPNRVVLRRAANWYSRPLCCCHGKQPSQRWQ